MYAMLSHARLPRSLWGEAALTACYLFNRSQPHPWLTRQSREESLVWLHGMAGVGKSAIAFTVAEMARLKFGSQESNEPRLAGSFFFSRKYTTRRTTAYFFATLAYQLARNFPGVRSGVNRVILDNPSLLDPKTSLRTQMNELFLQPLRRLRFRLRKCLPLVFVIDALDECGSKTDIADLISLLGQALRDPDLPVTYMLLTSRSEEHIREVFQREEVCPLVCEIPVKTSGEDVVINMSLDGADVDKDIYIFLEHSFRKLQSRSPDFPQPARNELARLAIRAGRRFIVACTMMEFISDVYNDPRERLQLILDLWSEPLPRTEAYKFYDSILSTCADPKRAYLLLSSVAALADPLPISDISNLLGPVQGRDVEGVLSQLRSVLDLPTDNSLPVNIYHSSVRDYVSDPSNCSLPQVQDIPLPQSLLTHSSFHLMRQDIPENMDLPDVFPVWKSNLTSFHTHDARLSINMCQIQDLGPAVDESYEFASSLRPLMEYTEGDNVNLRGICDFLSSPEPNVQCVALQLLEHVAEWENTKFTECMSETFGPVAELVLDFRDVQVHCAALDTLKLFLASPRAADIVKSMIPRGVVDIVCTDLDSKEPLVQLASVELLDAASQCEEILVEFVAAVLLIPSLLPSMLPTTQVTALRVLEFSAGSSTHELVKVVADTFHYLIQPLSSFETIVQIAALKVLEVGAGTKNHELARAVKTILPVLAKILSSGETDVRNAARKVLKAGAQLFDAETISPTLLPESSKKVRFQIPALHNESQASLPMGQEVLTKIQSSGKTDVHSAASKVLEVALHDIQLVDYVTIHAHLAYHPYIFPIKYDVSRTPDTASSSIPLDYRRRIEPATNPPITVLSLKSDLLPWHCEIYASMHPYITVEDVLSQLYRFLRTPATREEYMAIPSQSMRDKITESYRKRCLRASSSAEYAEEQSKGLKRVDFLTGRTAFMGLSSTKLGSDIWMLNLQ